MKALLLAEYRRFEMQELPAPAAGAGEVVVRVAACGICGSDVHGFDGSSGRRVPPIVMGHEAAGEIASLGSDVAGFAVGDRVTLDSTVYCGSCGPCARGDVNLCDRREVLGVSCGDYRRAGAFAEYVAVPARIVYRLPSQVSFPEAALLEAVSVALHAVSLSGATPGSSALVIGAGVIGLLCAQALRVAGCDRILLADTDATRLAKGKSVGAAMDTLCASGAELGGQVRCLTAGTGVDLVIEAVGKDETVGAAVECVRKGGTVTLVGNISPQVALPLQKVVTRQIRLQGSCASAGEYPRAIELLASGEIKVKPLISVVAPLEEGPQWFERLYAREPGLVKVVLSPGETLGAPAREGAQP